MEAETLIPIALLVLGFGLLSTRLERSALTPPMVFVAAGALLGGSGLGWLDIERNDAGFQFLGELTLVLVLFGDAARINLRALRRELGLPVRLLGLGLPLCIGLGCLAALWVFPHFSLWEAAVLGAVLAPTDAALGEAVVSSERVPLRIRQALNVESGLNDGIALPGVTAFAVLAAASADARSPLGWASFVAQQVTLGPLVGAGVAWLGAQAVLRAGRAGTMDESYERLAGVAVALLCYTLAEVTGGNGFIATFVGGITMGTVMRGQREWGHTFMESEGQLLVLLVFLCLGVFFVSPAYAQFGTAPVLYAALSLTVVRMLPVALSLVGTRLNGITVLFLGWFGPRGLASVLFALLVVSRHDVPHAQELFAVVITTVVLSVVFHGLTALPAALRYGRAMEGQAGAEEHKPVLAHPLRMRPRIRGSAPAE